ncbi:Coiled-coil domain-containing protein 124 -like protein [Ceratocystis fimbriata CBS 114723]|uniref:Coiled-coil domain-containing protein 124-like protein n=1 Tax=Ceratocystis fimbriata CBS 114723 TaxID=1035309 RepID=A0A2C5X4D5_9PEZI|nr:Coiled-coil domain-containing protein 124 -like protein [Ceratocystis fimbriata CBS 114723]
MGRTFKDMGGKTSSGAARKAEAAAEKKSRNAAAAEAAEAKKWEQGAKSSSKKDAETAKKAEAARKKAEKEALMREEEASLPQGKGRASKNAQKAVKKTRGLNLDQIDSMDQNKPSTSLSALNASGIDSALDALTLANDASNEIKVETHPERRYPRALKAYMERRLVEMQNSGEAAGLRKQQREERIVKEFEKSPENPFNQVTATYNATREDLRDMRSMEKQRMEKHLTK